MKLFVEHATLNLEKGFNKSSHLKHHENDIKWCILLAIWWLLKKRFVRQSELCLKSNFIVQFCKFGTFGALNLELSAFKLIFSAFLIFVQFKSITVVDFT